MTTKVDVKRWNAEFGCAWIAAAATLAAFLSLGQADAASSETVKEAVCRLIDSSAARYHLPSSFLTRLIWNESSFRAGVVSPAGAQGIAQFMPGTAAERRLANPFDPEQAIVKSAELLADLKTQFGNLGLAAAAYNAGPTRVASWLAKKGGLPAETQVYVLRITGHSADEWAADLHAQNQSADKTAPKRSTPTNCLAVTASLRVRGNGGTLAPVFSPWGVQLAGGFSRAAAIAQFNRNSKRYSSMIGKVRPMIIGTRLLSRGSAPFYRVRIPEPTRAAAEAQCRRIMSAGGSCVALRS